MSNYWEDVYQSKQAEQVSWYQSQDIKALELIKFQALSLDAQIIDVGSGASVFIDQLLEMGYKNLHVLDLSETALKTTQARLQEKGRDASHVQWLVADVCTVNLPQQFFDVWHDRAVFHFMVTEEQQQNYLNTMQNSLKANALVMISTFAEDGPTKCSGLDVQRYSAETLAKRLGENFQLLHHETDLHITPWGSEQKFLHTLWKFQNEDIVTFNPCGE